jgi:hypothetical protein
MKIVDPLFRVGERFGFAWTVVCAIAWLACGVYLVRVAAGASLLWRYPALGVTVEVILGTVVAIGGLLAYWLIAGQIGFLRRGYRIRRISGNDYLYEERVPSREKRSLPFMRVVVGKGYPVPSEVFIASETAWELGVPYWAKGRRGEIARRIGEALGANQGASVRFLDI